MRGWRRLARIVQGVETPVIQGRAEARAEPVHPTAEDTEEPLILVVDDDATVRDLVQRHLERAGLCQATSAQCRFCHVPGQTCRTQPRRRRPPSDQPRVKAASRFEDDCFPTC